MYSDDPFNVVSNSSGIGIPSVEKSFVQNVSYTPHKARVFVLSYFFQDNGKSVTVKVVDRCHDCEGKYNVDMTKTAFKKLEPNLDVGRLCGVQWEWV